MRVLVGDALEQLRTLPDSSVHMCVTSPPYYGLRDYGVAGQLGLESTPEQYIENLVAVFREVRRVLRDDGTLWLNLGDSYSNAGTGGNGATGGRDKSTLRSQMPPIGTTPVHKSVPTGMKQKDLMGIPWSVAFALRSDGWFLRQDIIWHKPNPMPESVRDRCTKAHEYMFLLSKSGRYYFDGVAIAEDAVRAGTKNNATPRHHEYAMHNVIEVASMKNRRSVWTVSTHSYKGAHFATFPPKLIEPCIKAGTSERGACVCGKPLRRITEKIRTPTRTGEASVKSPDPERHVTEVRTTGWEEPCCGGTPVPCVVLDPFAGSGTTGQVAKSLNRDAILIELNPEYRCLIEQRIAG